MRVKGEKVKNIYNSRMFERFAEGYKMVVSDISNIKSDFDYGCILRDTVIGTLSWETLGFLIASVKYVGK